MARNTMLRRDDARARAMLFTYTAGSIRRERPGCQLSRATLLMSTIWLRSDAPII